MDHIKALHFTAGRKLTVIDRFLRALAVYVIPACMVIVSLVAAMMLNKVYPDISGNPVALRVLPTSEHTALDPVTVYETLTQQPPALAADTGKSAWLLAEVPRQDDFTDFLLEFPSRHVSGITCWDPATMEIIGKASRTTRGPHVNMAKLGFTIAMGHLPYNQQILCHGGFAQSGPITARLWTVSDFHQAASKFDHSMGMLEGGLLTPAIFSLIIALITRESTYALLGAWLVANLRLGAFAIGWDSQWLGYLIPIEAMPLIRHLTAGVYYLLTVALLARLLRVSGYHGHRKLLSATKISALAMPVLALVVPNPLFWPVIGLVAIFGLIATIVVLADARLQARLTVWFWQVLSLCVAFSILIGLTALIIFGDINGLNTAHTTVLLLVSNTVMVLAMLERVRNTRFEQRRLQTELVTSYAITPIAMFTLDAQHRFTRMNPVLENLLGITVASHPEAKWTDFFDELDWDDLNARTLANEDVEVSSKLPFTNGLDAASDMGFGYDTVPGNMPGLKNGSHGHGLDNSGPASLAGKMRHFAIRAIMVEKTIEGSLQDITAHAALIEQVRVMAGKDPVTQALNQRGIENAVQQAMRLISNQPASLACLNLSHFKSINSLFGYTTGDALLIQTRRAISEALKQRHEIGRVGGDEFAILFPGKTAKEVEPAVQELADAINNRTFTIGAHSMTVKTAIGLIDLSPELSDAKEAMFAAGRACRDARKDQHRVVTYERDSAALREHRELLRVFDQLEAGYTPEGFRIELQPILSMQNYAQSWNFEVLLRVNDSEGNPLEAGRVIAAAEDIGPITTIDKWVLEYILSWLDEHARRMPQLGLISINVSGVSLNSEPFTQHLFRLLDRYKNIAGKLVIEMTEGVALENLERSQSVMRQLQAMGVRVGLDDFGSGYTSFSYLRSLKADVIKIDGSLIHNMLSDDNNIAIVQTIIQLAAHLNMKCIAEWVEDAKTLETLYKMGIDYVQGFVVSPSIPLESVLQAKSMDEFLVTDDARQFVRRVLHRQV